MNDMSDADNMADAPLTEAMGACHLRKPATKQASAAISRAVLQGRLADVCRLADEWLFDRAESLYLLRAAAEDGPLEVLQFLVADYDARGVDLRGPSRAALLAACANDRLGAVQWLVRRLEFPEQTQVDAVHQACAAGRTGVAQWLAVHFGLELAVAVDERGNTPLAAACSGGHLTTARWLVDQYGIGPREARADDNYALSIACANGHLDAAEWLITTFNLTVMDLSARRYAGLRWAYHDGEFDLVRTLMQRFGMGAAERGRSLIERLEPYCGDIDSDYGDSDSETSGQK